MEKALMIYKKLVSDGEIDDIRDSELYNDFKDEDVRRSLYEFEKTLDFKIIDVPHKVYMVPGIENDIFGFTLRDMREGIGSHARLVDAFLNCYIIMTILSMFFGGKNNDPKKTGFVQVKDVVAALEKKFQEVPEGGVTWEEDHSINFKNIADVWKPKLVIDDSRKVTKNELVLRACRLLRKQRLVTLHDEDREIRTTVRLDDLMRHHYLNEKRVSEIMNLFP